MDRTYDRILQTMDEARHLPATRRGFLGGTTKLAAGSAIALAALAVPALRGFTSVSAQDFTNDVDVLNYALTLEHLEATFYREGQREFTAGDFSEAGFDAPAYEYFDLIGDHEQAHVDTLISVIQSLGGTPVSQAMYDFGYDDVAGYVAVAQVLENVGTGAYTGAANSIQNADLLTAALTIHGVEARHAAYLNLINGDVPFPEAFETPLSRDEVLAAAGPLIVSEMPATGTGSSR
ncbi:MAG: ferritin-like domain-containing protein [Thermomicrobiales bacterium]